jgi:plastocyanin
MPTTADEIVIQDFDYTTPVSVSPGATVSVTNMDTEAHTVTADSAGAFDVAVPPGSTATLTAPMTPGSYDFHCLFHANMDGVLVVS